MEHARFGLRLIKSSAARSVFAPDPIHSHTMSSAAEPILSQGAGWAVVIGLGLGFSGIMLLITAAQERYTGLSVSNQDEFSSASVRSP